MKVPVKGRPAWCSREMFSPWKDGSSMGVRRRKGGSFKEVPSVSFGFLLAFFSWKRNGARKHWTTRGVRLDFSGVVLFSVGVQQGVLG